ncbi:uncharacterized protein LOC114268682 [Camellia sinensis]|uniref:uncharacterized protein LOC114268682 n=1 Tax=Camellia sinensis TaxID=4442 RepID=UPI001036CAD4|nr:uncharacterized protein LOC114268682 [Camellia sinensis]
MELVDIMIRRRVSIACVQETKWMGEKVREIENTDFKLYYSGKDKQMNRVGIIVAKDLVENIVVVIRKGDRIILVKLVVGENIVNVISAYVPQEGLEMIRLRDFWDQIDDVLQEIPGNTKREKITGVAGRDGETLKRDKLKIFKNRMDEEGAWDLENDASTM